MSKRPFADALTDYARELRLKFSLRVPFDPEDQLKKPMITLVEAAGQILGRRTAAVTESRVAEVGGRPDLGVTVDSLLTGHLELKAPGKGADPSRFKGSDKEQWEKFKDLPNLVYSDGNEWALYRSGERIGHAVKLAGDATADGEEAADSRSAETLLELLRDFLLWEPIVPSSPPALAKLLAPLCRYLRTDVLTALRDSDSNLSLLADDWRKYLFPDADDAEFADAYAQTLTYALLLARIEGADDISVPTAVATITKGHRLLSDALKILGDDKAREAIHVPIDLLERVISAVDLGKLTEKAAGKDLWLYFYEDFLAAYDPKMRKDRGVYYTPVEVVQTQVHLVAELLERHFDADFSFADPKVVTLDPAAGTGTYLLAALRHGLDSIAANKGEGMKAAAATRAGKNIYAFEMLVGPYSVAHLRLTQALLEAGGSLPPEGAHVYLTDTLESPHAIPPQTSFLYKELGEEHKRAQRVKATVPVLVCLGNPPYDRQQRDEAEAAGSRRKGGWVRFGDEGKEEEAILRDFLKPLAATGGGLHAKNLYNDYVYFWRWALWKVFESKGGPGIISFITAASYLRGPGFAGMRRVMRETFDDLWIIDLEGDNLGARKTENVFAIQTPVAIAVGVRYGKAKPDKPATVRYARIEGSRDEKLAELTGVKGFGNIDWRKCLEGWQEPFLPRGESDYWDWPLLTDFFPWQECGMQFKRSWPIGESRELLVRRWKILVESPNRKQLFRETPDRKISLAYASLSRPAAKDIPLGNLDAHSEAPVPKQIAYRSFDRQWALIDNRLGDRLRPVLQQAHGNRQIYLAGLLTDVLGEGPSLVAATQLPDMHYFCNRGARDVIPLWQDAEGKKTNITAGVLEKLSTTFGQPVSPEDVLSYAYALLAGPGYVEKFWEELTIPGPRLPITRDAGLFFRATALGRKLIWLHTYGERFVPKGKKPGRVPRGVARCKVGTPADAAEYPETFSYDPSTQQLHVGKGVFEKVRPAVWQFSISGLEVVKSWLGYRMKERSGKKSSPLDDIRPLSWAFDEELLDLLWVLDHTVDLQPEMGSMLEAVLSGALHQADEFPAPSPEERRGPQRSYTDQQAFDFEEAAEP